MLAAVVGLSVVALSADTAAHLPRVPGVHLGRAALRPAGRDPRGRGRDRYRGLGRRRTSWEPSSSTRRRQRAEPPALHHVAALRRSAWRRSSASASVAAIELADSQARIVAAGARRAPAARGRAPRQRAEPHVRAADAAGAARARRREHRAPELVPSLDFMIADAEADARRAAAHRARHPPAGARQRRGSPQRSAAETVHSAIRRPSSSTAASAGASRTSSSPSTCAASRRSRTPPSTPAGAPRRSVTLAARRGGELRLHRPRHGLAASIPRPQRPAPASRTSATASKPSVGASTSSRRAAAGRPFRARSPWPTASR